MSNVDYPNRSDLRNPAKRVATGQTYGKATEQMRAQQAVPMGRSPVEVRPKPSAPRPGALGPLTRPSEKMAEPITAGVNFGDGPNAVQAGIPMATDPEAEAIDELMAIYQAYPSPQLAMILGQNRRRF